MKTENQLQFVRNALDKLPRSDWVKVAVASDVTVRTVYNVHNATGRPGYDVVFRIYDALKNKRHELARAK